MEQSGGTIRECIDARKKAGMTLYELVLAILSYATACDSNIIRFLYCPGMNSEVKGKARGSTVLGG